MSDEKKYMFKWTKNSNFRMICLMLALLSALALFLLQNKYKNQEYGSRDAHRVEQIIQDRTKILNEEFDLILNDSAAILPKLMDERAPYHMKLIEEEGIYIFLRTKGRLMYWSDNTVDLGQRWVYRNRPSVVELRSGAYAAVYREFEDRLLIGLILIKSKYSFENEYLKNEYQKGFKLRPEIEFLRTEEAGSSAVFNAEGDYLFSLGLKGVKKENQKFILSSIFLFLLSVGLLFVFLSLRIDLEKDPRARARWLALSLLILTALSVLVILFEVPEIIFHSRVFSPDVFASFTFSSLGQLWLLVMLVMFIALHFYWFFDRSKTIPERVYRFVGLLIVLIASLYFVFVHQLIKTIVLDSTISFELQQLNSLSVFTFIGLLVIVMAYLIFALLMDKAIQFIRQENRVRVFLIYLFFGLIIQIPLIFVNVWNVEIHTLAFYFLISISIFYLRISTTERIHFSRFFIPVFAFAVFLTLELYVHNSEKINYQKEIELAKLSSEHDVVAEMLFEALSDSLKNDDRLHERMKYQIIDDDLILEYLQRNYFSGYWTKYDLLITVCRPADSVLIEGVESDWYHCYSFFDEVVSQAGLKVQGSDFYYLDNLNGRISYLAAIPYVDGDMETTLYLELDSKIISEELGYPSLLLKEESGDAYSFSYAKYNNGKLITSGGRFDYRLNSSYYTSNEKTFEEFKSEGYNHTIFNIDPHNTIIVSAKNVGLVDIAIAFSYVFAFLFFIFAVTYLTASITHLRTNVNWDFKNKIQYSTIGILFFSFLVVCTGTIFFVIQQYRIKHQDNMDNTMRSLYIELVHKVDYAEDLRTWSSEKYYNLDELLRKFSNVFNTDINMYDRRGHLLATSRSEIYEQGLVSRQMNRQAFEKLAFENYSAFTHVEKIGNMSYQSAYIPLLNSENSFLAYLNLPYFSQPEVLAQEVSNLVVAILNTYAILLLLILFLSVFLADRITQPLRFIRDRIAHLAIGETNEKIIYTGKDEIAGLVDEYNYMVDELERSAQLLAQSERETAWREMAKQIAHEIKNPLTPMKLSVQHLQRMAASDADDLEEKINRVSNTLIEQIDSLTLIANEFSDFAKMPRAKNRDIDVIKKLETVANLFETSEGVNIGLNLNDLSDVKTYGDPEQFQRVIINLVKNGIQSVPDGREKKITIELEDAPEQTVIISITDNGKGIPGEIQDKLFQPNFTTKSSGMGMGLAITSNIVKSMNGNIWYSTKEGEGTTFFIKVPREHV